MLSVNELFGEEKSIYEYIEDDIEKRNKQIEELKNMNLRERQYTVFKMFYDGIDENNKKLLDEATKEYPLLLTQIYPLINTAIDALLHKRISLYNREEVMPYIMLPYKDLLKKLSKLSQKLNIDNSLALSILFSYLLWNGYLSKDKTYKFQSSGRKNLSGMLFIEIMDGFGVCINNTEMLKDVLNECGYKSCTMVNHIDSFMKVKNTFRIKRQGVDTRRNIIKELIKIRRGNHAFNLIEDDNQLYVYDSTNLLLYNIENPSHANLINGKGKNLLFPYTSYHYSISDDEKTLLDKFLIGENNYKLYTKEDYLNIGEVNLDIIESNISLIEDFYTEVRPYIVGISEETDRIVKKRQRTK